MSLIPLPVDPSYYYSPIYFWVFQVVSFPQVSPPKLCTHLSSPHSCYTPRPAYSSRLDHPINIWWGLQIINLLIMYSSPIPCYIVSLRPEYYPQQTNLQQTQPTFLPQCERHVSRSCNTTGTIIVLCVSIFIFLKSTLDYKRFCTEW